MAHRVTLHESACGIFCFTFPCPWPQGEERGRDGHIRRLKEIEISAFCMLVACTLISDVDIA